MAATLSPAVAYELWAPTYPSEAHNPLMRTEQAVVERVLTHLRAGRALDVGTGSGRYLPILAGCSTAVVGVDLSMAMLRRGVPRNCLCADARLLPFRAGSFDLVNASLMVGDISDLRGWLGEMARVLSVAGHLVYSDFHPTWTTFGWQRTFRTVDGVLQTMEFEPHSIDDHVSALGAAGFRILTIHEPRLVVGGRRRPVVAIFHVVKDVPTPR